MEQIIVTLFFGCMGFLCTFYTNKVIAFYVRYYEKNNKTGRYNSTLKWVKSPMCYISTKFTGIICSAGFIIIIIFWIFKK